MGSQQTQRANAPANVRKFKCRNPDCGAWHTGHHRTPVGSQWPYYVSSLCRNCSLAAYEDRPASGAWEHQLLAQAKHLASVYVQSGVLSAPPKPTRRRSLRRPNREEF